MLCYAARHEGVIQFQSLFNPRYYMQLYGRSESRGVRQILCTLHTSEPQILSSRE